MSSTLIKSYRATADIPASRWCVIGSAVTNLAVAAASAATAPLIGASHHEVDVKAGEMVDVVHGGLATVEAGAAFSAGAPLTSDSVGRAIAAAPAAGVNNWIGGIALDAAVAAGDLVRVLLAPGRIQG